MAWGVSPISSRKMVPASACRQKPSWSRSAPVKEPRTWPKSWLSSRVSGIAPQLMATKGPSERSLRWWIDWAISSLPVPLSPLMSTVAVVAAILSTILKTDRMRALWPMMFLGRDLFFSCFLSWMFSVLALRSASALRTTILISSFLQCFCM